MTIIKLHWWLYLSNSKQANSTLRLLAICGIASVVWFNLLVLIAGSMYEGYDHVMMYISMLGAVGSSTAWFFNPLGFYLVAVLSVLFWIGMYIGGAGRIGSLSFIVGNGVGFIMLGAFPVGPETLDMHLLGFLILVAGGILGMFFFAESMRRSEGWKNLWKYTLITAIAYTLFYIAHQNQVFDPMVGLSQRVMSWITWLWTLVIAYRLYRISQSSQ